MGRNILYNPAATVRERVRIPSEEEHMLPRVVRRMLLVALAVGLLAAVPVAHAQPASGEPIKIGAVISITGPAAGLGVPERNVLQMTEKVIGSKSGVMSGAIMPPPCR